MAQTVEDMVSAARAEIDEVTVAQARALHRDKVTFIDVREPGECAKGSIEGALQIPRGVLEWKVGAEPALADRDQPVVVYCQSGGRSALSAAVLKKMGFTGVRSLAGGYALWSADD